MIIQFSGCWTVDSTIYGIYFFNIYDISNNDIYNINNVLLYKNNSQVIILKYPGIIPNPPKHSYSVEGVFWNESDYNSMSS